MCGRVKIESKCMFAYSENVLCEQDLLINISLPAVVSFIIWSNSIVQKSL